MPLWTIESANAAVADGNQYDPPDDDDWQPPPPPDDLDAPESEPGPVTLDRGDQAELAELIVTRLARGTHVTWDGSAAWVYNHKIGIYEQVTKQQLRAIGLGFAGSWVAVGKTRDGEQKRRPLMLHDSTLNGTCAIIETSLLPKLHHRTFAQRVHGVAFRNGFARVSSGNVVLVPHSPEHMARAAFDFDYDPDAPHDALDQFFEDVWSDASEDDRAARRAVLCEFVGACMMGAATRYQRACILLGHGGNGKSTMGAIIEACFPPSAVSHLSPRDWSKPFALIALDGKLINICDELPEREAAGDTFKQVVGGSPMDTDRKFESRCTVRSIAGHLFAGNEPPPTSDTTEGYFRRLIPVPFNVPQHTRVERRIGAEREILQQLPGVLAVMLRAGAELEKRGGYVLPESSESMLEDMRDEADNVRQFVKWKITDVGNGPRDLARWSGADFYASYTEWCGKNGHKPMASVKFSRRAVATKLVTRRKSSGILYEPSDLGWETHAKPATPARVQ